MRIDWSDLALDDIDEIRHYIAREHAFEAAHKLLEFPMRDRACPKPTIRKFAR